MRLGTVRLLHDYLVDLDDPKQVERAKAFLKSDICQMAVHPDRDADLDMAIGVSEHDDRLLEVSEQPEVVQLQFQFTEDPEDFVYDSSYTGLESGDGEQMLLDPGDHVVTMDDAIEMERMNLLRDNIRHLSQE
jgi:hypothetical protein